MPEMKIQDIPGLSTNLRIRIEQGLDAQSLKGIRDIIATEHALICRLASTDSPILAHQLPNGQIVLRCGHSPYHVYKR